MANYCGRYCYQSCLDAVLLHTKTFCRQEVAHNFCEPNSLVRHADHISYCLIKISVGYRRERLEE